MRARELIQKSAVPEGESGQHRIERFEVSAKDAEMERIRSIFQGGNRAVPEGTYTRLVRGPAGFGHTVVMSDTPAEMRDHFAPVREARGNCLVHGLGLGLVAEAMLRKDSVEHVTVVEKSGDVIALVAPYLSAKWGDRLSIVEADAMEWAPPKGARFGVVWHDIWDHICADNLPDMKRLHRRYGRRSDWQGSWARELIR